MSSTPPEGYPTAEILKSGLINQAANLAVLQAEIAVLRRIVSQLATEQGSSMAQELVSGVAFQAGTKIELEKILLAFGDGNPDLARQIYERLKGLKWNPDDPSSGFEA